MGKIFCVFMMFCILAGCDGRVEKSPKSSDKDEAIAIQSDSVNKDAIVAKYKNVIPKEWSEDIDGVIKTLPTNDKVLALTLDLCGSKKDNLDEGLVAFLEENKIPVTFFVNYRWIQKFPDKFERLYKNTLFEIENHGYGHLPASVSGRAIYGIGGTKNSAELYNEVVANADFIENITGHRPKFYRSGTAYYDEYAVKQIYDMGAKPVGFSVLGDAGATYPAWKVRDTVLTAKAGDIIICHANHPEKETGRGLMAVLPRLLKRGFRFVRLDEYLK